MKIVYTPTSSEVRRQRREEYLARYPIEAQLEALTEAAMGRPKKLNELLIGLSGIREALPFSEKEAIK